ncbi:capreomycidine synthase [Streptomyces antimicrobicus]|uniref:Capreomycidine synthase n=1 Tax=Streptomyces antimicrobicus TaxID=2883108 RepID=A0ABS8B2H8_9ACTN|nr:capreomycidine synthase [Streptomyces antimicrobicus]MCB5178805.1 capreomycidine synthase [Streptomyces antimicrobicus]
MSSLRPRREDPPVLEEWYRRHLGPDIHDISSSGVHPYTFAEIRDLCRIPASDLDAVVMDDSVSQGGAGIRQAVADRYAGGDADRVLVTHGSSEAIALTLSTLLHPGDRVVVQEGIYHSLGHYPRAAGCDVVTLPLAAVRDGEIDPEVLTALVTPGTAAVVVNFPHNPTGVTLSPQGLKALTERAAVTGAALVWDAATAEIAHRWEVLPDPGADGGDTVSYGTFSKTFGLPGLRVGWAVAPKDLLTATFPLRDRTTLFLSPLVELVAERAMRHADALIAPRAAEARRNLAYLTQWMAEHEDLVRWTPPEGGVCALPVFRELERAGSGPEAVERFCLELLARHRTLLVPGTAFGAPHGARLGFGGPEDSFRAGLAGLSQFLRARGAGR